ncbi:MAG: DUF3570 domain-containing protein [Betaproteobacteria bacterium]|nr:MAG: DUF3570 domain-containing protein [Betaproteobacteria bacterium]
MAAIRLVSPQLAAFTAAAMALPGVHARAADAPRENPWAFDATHMEYSESGGRMNVRVNQASAIIPIGDSFQLKANGIQDLVSGASPIFNAPGPGGKPQQVLTGASVRDNRKAGDIGASAAFGDNQLTLRQGWSNENDYKSTWTSLESRYDLNRKNTTLAAGFAFSNDGVSNHDTPDDFRTRIKRDFFVGITQVIDERSLVQLSLEYSYSNAYLCRVEVSFPTRARASGGRPRRARSTSASFRRSTPHCKRWEVSRPTIGACAQAASSCNGKRSCRGSGWSTPAPDITRSRAPTSTRRCMRPHQPETRGQATIASRASARSRGSPV